MSGPGFAVFTGRGALLERALISSCSDILCASHGYTEVSTPFLVKPLAAQGTGQLPSWPRTCIAPTRMGSISFPPPR